jgi:SAM-dependent methyltransferase
MNSVPTFPATDTGGRRLPWWLKMALKGVLTRLPVPYGFWRRLNMFRHGIMDEFGYAERVTRAHLRRADGELETGFTALEIGPGDSLLSAVCARSAGAGRIYLVDVGRFAVRDVEPYRAFARSLTERQLPAPDLDDVTSLDEVLDRCGAVYLTDGVESMSELPPQSVDISWSQAALEHVRRSDLESLVSELYRVHRPATVSSHRVDLRDHLANALNNLRFSERRWEGKLFADSGFYTNRLRCDEFLRVFEGAGFETRLLSVERWPSLPTPRHRMVEPYRSLSDDELLIADFDVVLRRP